MSNKKSENKRKGTMKHFLLVFFGTLFLGIIISTFTTAAVEHMKTIVTVLVVLVLVIAVGVLFDGIGVAVAVADPAPFHARASRRAAGAKVTLKLIRKASVVANVCCDVVGDICGIVSGALGATIALLLVAETDANSLFLSSCVAGMVSALTVGGKALMKTVAISEADKIMELVGLVLDYKNWSLLWSAKKDGKGA